MVNFPLDTPLSLDGCWDEVNFSSYNSLGEITETDQPGLDLKLTRKQNLLYKGYYMSAYVLFN